MNGQWHFRPLTPRDKDRQPILDEFFTIDALKSRLEGLIRESIQNSLDARDAGKPVHVRFTLAEVDSARVARFFESAIPHLQAKGNGLSNPPSFAASEKCRFILVEDYGTTGLTGNVAHWDGVPEHGEKNPFYFFFRTEGRSGKGEKDRGRWGIGKFVFPRSSRLSSFIAVTVRADDKQRLMMGQSILKSHKLNGRTYKPDGDFGLTGGDEDALVMPIVDAKEIDNLCEAFGITRKTESGLSIIVPWVHDEMVDASLMVESIVDNYFHPILFDNLAISVSNAGQETRIDRDTLKPICASMPLEIQNRILPLIDLAETSHSQERIPLKPSADGRPTWDNSFIPSEQLRDLSTRFLAGEKLSFEIPVSVKLSTGEEKSSCFQVTLRKDGSSDGRPVFIREGLIISRVRSWSATNVISLVEIENGALAELLADSENPAHTEWQKDSEHLRGRFHNPDKYIAFVSGSVHRLVRMLSGLADAPDRRLLSRFFSAPKPDENASTNGHVSKGKGKVSVPMPRVPAVLRRYIISQAAGGFSIRGTTDGGDLECVQVKVAYDVRKGSPLKAWSPIDFEINKAPIRITGEGCTYIAEKNILKVTVQKPDFSVHVMGFDTNRDLYVKADSSSKEKGDDSAN